MSMSNTLIIDDPESKTKLHSLLLRNNDFMFVCVVGVTFSVLLPLWVCGLNTLPFGCCGLLGLIFLTDLECVDVQQC